MATIHIANIVWTDGELSGDPGEITQLHRYRLALEPGEQLPVFGNGPWVDPNTADPAGFIALAEAALGVSTWTDEGIEWPAFWTNPSDQDEVIA